MSPSTAINQCILSFPQACRRQTEESNFFVTDMYEYWNFVRRTLICLRGRMQKPHTADLQILHYILHTLGNLVSINFFHHHTFLQAVSALGSGYMALWAWIRKIISDPQTCFLFSCLFIFFYYIFFSWPRRDFIILSLRCFLFAHILFSSSLSL